MEFSWTTFSFEIINFLILVWILQRFLYRPVTNAIARRKAGIESRLQEAETIRAAARELKLQYENRMAAWEEEKGKNRTRLMDEIAAERARSMGELRVALEQEREKARLLEQKEALESRNRIAASAYADASRFAAQLLSRIANASLEERIGEMMIEDLSRLPQDKVRPLRQECVGVAQPVRVASAYPVSQDARHAIAKALAEIAGKPVQCDFRRDPDLIGGFHLSIGSWALDCNLKNELGFFAETASLAG